MLTSLTTDSEQGANYYGIIHFPINQEVDFYEKDELQ